MSLFSSKFSPTQKLKDPENPTQEELMGLWDELTILPDHFSLRMLNYTDGTHAVARASGKGLGLSDDIDLVLTKPMATKEMYKYLMGLWLQAFDEGKEGDDIDAEEEEI